MGISREVHLSLHLCLSCALPWSQKITRTLGIYFPANSVLNNESVCERKIRGEVSIACASRNYGAHVNVNAKDILSRLTSLRMRQDIYIWGGGNSFFITSRGNGKLSLFQRVIRLTSLWTPCPIKDSSPAFVLGGFPSLTRLP